MEYLVTGEMARLIDRFTIDQTGVPSLILMERASLAVAVQVEKLAVSLEHAGEQRILSVCGSGNNGGDGMAAARILWCRGYDVSILLVGNPLKLSEDAGVQLRIARNMGVPVIEADQLKGFEDSELDEDIGIIRDIGKRHLRLHRIFCYVKAIDRSSSGSGFKDTGKHLDDRGLACAVRTCESDDLAFLYRKRNIINGFLRISVNHGKRLRFDHEWVLLDDD